jgi:O-antigen/teichoic acid export membrane protein
MADMATSIFVFAALLGLVVLIACANIWYWRRRSHLSKRQRDREDREEQIESEIW